MPEFVFKSFDGHAGSMNTAIAEAAQRFPLNHDGWRGDKDLLAVDPYSSPSVVDPRIPVR